MDQASIIVLLLTRILANKGILTEQDQINLASIPADFREEQVTEWVNSLYPVPTEAVSEPVGEPV